MRVVCVCAGPLSVGTLCTRNIILGRSNNWLVISCLYAISESCQDLIRVGGVSSGKLAGRSSPRAPSNSLDVYSTCIRAFQALKFGRLAVGDRRPLACSGRFAKHISFASSQFLLCFMRCRSRLSPPPPPNNLLFLKPCLGHLDRHSRAGISGRVRHLAGSRRSYLFFFEPVPVVWFMCFCLLCAHQRPVI